MLRKSQDHRGMATKEDPPSVADLARDIVNADAHHVQRTRLHEPYRVRQQRARKVGCWFMPRSWGGGFTPVAWQGWLVAAVSTLAVVASLTLLQDRAKLFGMIAILVCTTALAEWKGHPASAEVD